MAAVVVACRSWQIAAMKCVQIPEDVLRTMLWQQEVMLYTFLHWWQPEVATAAVQPGWLPLGRQSQCGTDLTEQMRHAREQAAAYDAWRSEQECPQSMREEALSRSSEGWGSCCGEECPHSKPEDASSRASEGWQQVGSDKQARVLELRVKAELAASAALEVRTIAAAISLQRAWRRHEAWTWTRAALESGSADLCSAAECSEEVTRLKKQFGDALATTGHAAGEAAGSDFADAGVERTKKRKQRRSKKRGAGSDGPSAGLAASATGHEPRGNELPVDLAASATGQEPRGNEQPVELAASATGHEPRGKDAPSSGSTKGVLLHPGYEAEFSDDLKDQRLPASNTALVQQPAMPPLHTAAASAGTSNIGSPDVVESGFAMGLAKEESQVDASAEELPATGSLDAAADSDDSRLAVGMWRDGGSRKTWEWYTAAMNRSGPILADLEHRHGRDSGHWEVSRWRDQQRDLVVASMRELGIMP